MAWDLAVLEALAEHRTAWADMLAFRVAAAGQPAGYVSALALAVLFAALFRAWWAVAAALLATVTATALAEYSKEFIRRPRPPADLALLPADGFAMPSSIAALTAGAATPLVVWGLRRADAIGRLVVAVLSGGSVVVGASMIYLGAHWVSDVLAGWALGALIGIIAFRVLHRVRASVRMPG